MKQGQVMDLGLPEGMDMVNHGDSLEITRRWFSPTIIFLTVFAVFWCGFLAFWYAMAMQGGDLFMLLFPILHLAVGIGLVYYVLAGYLNKTSIRVGWSSITIEHTPLPWLGEQKVDARDIKQIYVKESITRSRRGGTSTTYRVHALTHSGKNLKLLSGLPDSEQALFVEQEIEKFLRIEDVPVRGEMGRRDW